MIPASKVLVLLFFIYHQLYNLILLSSESLRLPLFVNRYFSVLRHYTVTRY